MSIYDDIVKQDALYAFLGEEFSESVVYTPKFPTASNPVRTIKAVINRNPPMARRANPNLIPPKMNASIANDAAVGITPAQLDTGGDAITVAYRLGTTAQPFRIHLPENGNWQDAGMITIELR